MNTTVVEVTGPTIRALPVRVRPVANESATSYFRRLCDANSLGRVS